MKLICQILGHKFSIRGLTGEYEWCNRCAKRRRMKMENLKANAITPPLTKAILKTLIYNNSPHCGCGNDCHTVADALWPYIEKMQNALHQIGAMDARLGEPPYTHSPLRPTEGRGHE